MYWKAALRSPRSFLFFILNDMNFVPGERKRRGRQNWHPELRKLLQRNRILSYSSKLKNKILHYHYVQTEKWGLTVTNIYKSMKKIFSMGLAPLAYALIPLVLSAAEIEGQIHRGVAMKKS